MPHVTVGLWPGKSEQQITDRLNGSGKDRHPNGSLLGDDPPQFILVEGSVAPVGG